MLRVDVPSEAKGAYDTFYYGGASIFSLAPCTEEAARKWAAHDRPRPSQPLTRLPPRYDDAEEDDDTRQACEGCEKEFDIETMSSNEDGCWFCQECLAKWRIEVTSCEHDFQPAGSASVGDRDCQKCGVTEESWLEMQKTLLGGGKCRVCGCSDLSACEDEGQPCSWAEPDLCSRCHRLSLVTAPAGQTEQPAEPV